MSTVLVVVLGTSALAFFGVFFLALCREGRQRPLPGDVVKLLHERESKDLVTSLSSRRRSA